MEPGFDVLLVREVLHTQKNTQKTNARLVTKKRKNFSISDQSVTINHMVGTSNIIHFKMNFDCFV